MEQPNVIALLPRPTDAATGQILVGPSYGLQSGLRKRRFEVVAAIDGESLNTYSVKRSRLLTSYPVAPHVNFTTAPCSVRSRSPADGPDTVYSYAAVQNRLGDSTYQVQCFEQASRGKQETGAFPAPLNATWSAKAGALSKVIHLEPLPAPPTGTTATTHQVLAFHQNAYITSLAAGLTTELWSVDVKSLIGTSDLETKFAFCMTGSQATRTLFQNREDLAITLQSASTDTDSHAEMHVAVMLTAKPDSPQHTLHAFALDNTSALRDPRPRLLVSWPLPLVESGDQSSEAAVQYAFHLASGVLQTVRGKVLVIYDFSGFIPKVVSTLTHHGPSLDALLPLEPSKTMVFTGDMCTVYDTHYQSIQGSRLFRDLDSMSQAKKRKRPVPETVIPVQPVLYFSSTKTAIVRKGQQLLSVHLDLPRIKKGRLGSRGSRLIDSLGRGVADSASMPLPEVSAPLQSAAESQDMESFSSHFFPWAQASTGSQCHIDLPKSRQLVQHLQRQVEEMSVGPRKEAMPVCTCKSRGAALFALKSIFVKTPGYKSKSLEIRRSEHRLRIRFLPPEILYWLLIHQALTPDHISLALADGDTLEGRIGDLSYADIVTAIASHDRSLIFLSPLLGSCNSLPCVGLVEALSCLITSFSSTSTLDEPEHEPEQRLTNGHAAATNGDTPMVDSALEHEVQAEEEAAIRDLTIATSLLETGISFRAQLLRSTLTKLGADYPRSDVVQAFRSQLSSPQVLTLIGLLRVELERGGWTTRSLDLHPAASLETQAQEDALPVIVSLLHCSIDALGVAGWLHGSASVGDDELVSEENATQLIVQLRDRTLGVLEGAQECAFFTGFLKDFVRFCEVADSDASTLKLTPGPGKPGKAALTVQESKLPFGLNSIQKVSSTRVGAGGELKLRSSRDVGNKISRGIGMYSFERIRI